jgi:hypothetical protein
MHNSDTRRSVRRPRDQRVSSGRVLDPCIQSAPKLGLWRSALRRSRELDPQRTQDLSECVRHNGKLLSGTLRLGVIPTLAPYVLPVLLPGLHCTHPDLCLDLLETQTETLVSELAQGTLDVLLAMPVRRKSVALTTSGDTTPPDRRLPRVVTARREFGLMLLWCDVWKGCSWRVTAVSPVSRSP